MLNEGEVDFFAHTSKRRGHDPLAQRLTKKEIPY